MSKEILVNITPQETRVAVIEQGAVQELHIERASSLGKVGNIYNGRVRRVLPGMQSAFIDIGLDRAAFLHVADIWGARQDGVAVDKPIEKLLHEGEDILVQVIKDPISSKGARLSTQISIAGRMLVYLPQESNIGISQRIEDENERELLREKMQTLTADEKGGYIVRTMAENASEHDLQTDIKYLGKQWLNIQDQFLTSSSSALIYQGLNLSYRALRDFVTDDTVRILVDSSETFQRMVAFADEYMANVKGRLEHYAGERPLFDLKGVEDEIERYLARRVKLKSGGYLIFDQTDALTTVDVNTGGFVGIRNFDDTIFKTNLEAAQIIARQLRLRNLGGVIIIDFIDMENEEHRNSVLTEFKRTLLKDRTKMTVNGFTALGLVEMTRKRTRESLAHTLCEPCPTCQSRGEVRTAQTICYEILRELLRESRQFDPREFRILASQQVIDLFLDEESERLTQLGDFIEKPISLQVETTYAQEHYDVILM